MTIPALLFLAPFLLALAFLVRLKLGAPVLFRQQRPGLHGKPFTLYKFRTMTDARDAQGALLPDAQRLTPFGRFLRSTSLDELPEFFNVLKGDMSLVGPRPLPVREIQQVPNLADRRRLSVKPGLTCLWQIRGRNEVRRWEDWVQLDLQYIDHWSLWLDLKIICQTIPAVLRGSGAK